MFKNARIFFVSIVVSTVFPASLSAVEKLTILHLNDTHGQIEPIKDKDGNTWGGFGRIAYLVDSLGTEAKTARRRFYFFHAGDALQGPPLSNVFTGELDFNLFNEMGLTAMAIGNHEFDFGPKRIRELKNIARFPLLAANITDTMGTTPFQPFLQDSLDSERLLIVGLTTETTPVTTFPPNVQGFRFLNAETTLTDLLDSLGYGDRDIIIVLSHRGWQADSALAEKIHDLDLVIGGHSHTVIEKPALVAQTVICQAGAKGIYLGKVDLKIDDGKVTHWSGELIPITGAIKEDSALSAKIKEASATLDQKLRTPIGTTEVALVPGFETGRKDVLSLGDLLARLMRDETKADIAFTNLGGVRSTIMPGPVSMLDILTALPFQNTVATIELTGEQVREVIGLNSSSESDAGGKLHLAGVELKKKSTGTVQTLIRGKPIESKKTYKIATNNFLARGGDGYTVLTRGKNSYDTGMTVNDLFVRYLERVGTITGKERL